MDLNTSQEGILLGFNALSRGSQQVFMPLRRGS